MTAQVEGQEILTQPESKRPVSRVGFRGILVAVDYLASTPELFEQALALAKVDGSRLMIFYCLQDQISGIPELSLYTAGMGPYAGVYSQEMIELEAKLLQETTGELKVWLGGLTQKASDAGIEAESDYSVGDAGRQICYFAKQWGADLIVIGRRGRRGMSELVLGSVSNYVIHHAHCSVLVVQH